MLIPFERRETFDVAEIADRFQRGELRRLECGANDGFAGWGASLNTWVITATLRAGSVLIESKRRSSSLFCRAFYPKSGVHFIGMRSSSVVVNMNALYVGRAN
jgi:hypothetical protein